RGVQLAPDVLDGLAHPLEQRLEGREDRLTGHGSRVRTRRRGPKPQEVGYISSMSPLNLSATTLRRSLRLGVSSPSSTVRSRPRMWNFLICSCRFRPALSSST